MCIYICVCVHIVVDLGESSRLNIVGVLSQGVKQQLFPTCVKIEHQIPVGAISSRLENACNIVVDQHKHIRGMSRFC